MLDAIIPSPLIQRYARRHDGVPQARKDAAGNQYPKGARRTARGTCLQRRAEASDDHADECGIAAAKRVVERLREEHVAQPGADIVDGRDEARARRIRLVEEGHEAWVDEDGREDADIVAARALLVSLGCWVENE